MNLLARYSSAVDRTRHLGLARDFKDLRFSDACHAVDRDGHRLFVICSNDYLGLRFHPDVMDAAKNFLAENGSGSSGARMVSGSHPICSDLEEELAAFKGTEAALLFTTGYMANIGLISAIAGEGDIILSDEKNHASIIDGCRLSRAKTHIYPHRDWESARNLLQKYRNAAAGCFIVTDGVFSMDGTIAPLPNLLQLAEEFDSFLIIDEAHALGVLGEDGHGSLEHFAILPQPRIISVGTCSKALGSLGGFVCGPFPLIHFLRSHSRPFLCSTMLPASVVAATRQSLELLKNASKITKKLHRLSTIAKHIFRENAIDFPSDAVAIFPISIGDEKRATVIAEKLYREGIYLREIRYPSVSLGAACLRLTVCASYDEQEWINALGRVAVAATD